MEMRTNNRNLVFCLPQRDLLGYLHCNPPGSEGCPLLLITKPQWATITLWCQWP